MAVGSNLTLKDKKLSIEAKESFRILEKALSPAINTNPTFEPIKLGLPQGRKGESTPLSPSLCGDWDEVRTYGDKVKRVAALIYAHFKNELLMPKGR